jgi:hypothetical protein
MSNKGIITGSGNVVGSGCSDINLIGCTNCIVHPLVINLTAVNCTNQTFTKNDDDSFYINNGRIVTNRSRLATASAPTFVNGDYNLYYVNTSGGNANIYINYLKLIDQPITFKVIDATNDIIFNTLDNAGLIEFNALPYTYTPALGDSITITSNGTDLFMVWNYNTATGGGGGGLTQDNVRRIIRR